MLAKKNNLMQQHGKQAIQANWDFQVMVNLASRAKTLTNFCWTLEPGKKQQMLQNKLGSNIWNYAGNAARKATLPDFLKILTVFIWKKRYKARENLRENQINFWQGRDFTWIANYLV